MQLGIELINEIQDTVEKIAEFKSSKRGFLVLAKWCGILISVSAGILIFLWIAAQEENQLFPIGFLVFVSNYLSLPLLVIAGIVGAIGVIGILVICILFVITEIRYKICLIGIRRTDKKASMAVDFLTDYMLYPKLCTRRDVIEILGDIGNIKATQACINVLQYEEQRENKEATIAAIRLLIKLKDRNAIEPLAVLLKDKDRSVRLESARALQMLGYEPKSKSESVDYLISQKSWYEVEKYGEDAVKRLIEVLNDSKGKIPRGLVSTLGRLGEKRAVVPIINAASSVDDWHTRLEAAEALGGLNDARAIPVLENMLERRGEAERVKWAIKESLKQLRKHNQ